eukprot:COSAG05_NODE_1023_length_6126_cov_6.196117_5_plen_88_part_00
MPYGVNSAEEALSGVAPNASTLFFPFLSLTHTLSLALCVCVILSLSLFLSYFLCSLSVCVCLALPQLTPALFSSLGFCIRSGNIPES